MEGPKLHQIFRPQVHYSLLKGNTNLPGQRVARTSNEKKILKQLFWTQDLWRYGYKNISFKGSLTLVQRSPAANPLKPATLDVFIMFDLYSYLFVSVLLHCILNQYWIKLITSVINSTWKRQTEYIIYINRIYL